ncbi:unnamed protein product [Ranitomeya imitator]|uniref:Uncharacterized protein n=1 Tax=Ranitomeya imitator TaxID=111125 RepID=A0ABN9LS33_9NEOB|nr:unnamed protein product [Ranitomeya imitator]
MMVKSHHLHHLTKEGDAQPAKRKAEPEGFQIMNVSNAPSTHITTRGSIPPTLPHEAPSPHITTRGSVSTHYHMRLCPHTLPHEALSPYITIRGSAPTHYHTRLRTHTLPQAALPFYVV